MNTAKKIEKTVTACAVIGAILGFIGTVCFLLSCFIFEMEIGSPSSTSALIIIFIPFLGGVGTIVGLGIGVFIGFLLKIAFRIEKIRVISVFLMLLIVTVVAAISSGHIVISRYIEYNKPRVIVNKNVIYKSDSGEGFEISDKKELWNYTKEQPDKLPENEFKIEWNNNNIIINFDEHKIYIKSNNGKVNIVESLKGYNYIRQLIPVVIKFGPNESDYLAIVANLRATSYDTILCIYNPKGELIYQELLEYIANVHKARLLNLQEALILEDRTGDEFVYCKKQ